MKITFLPQTYLGKWSVGLIVVFITSLGLLAFFSGIAGQTFHENPWLLMPVLMLITTGISSLIVGLISVALKRERSILVYLAAGLGLLFILFELGDILFHY